MLIPLQLGLTLIVCTLSAMRRPALPPTVLARLERLSAHACRLSEHALADTLVNQNLPANVGAGRKPVGARILALGRYGASERPAKIHLDTP